eukprot:TRINITY_DN3482_c0_g1_i5.p1 TRINITY_DN3482_c0_g1~~TRINITY_DN3482_c0_g1_i5.p1  ORF type:complete len:125 (-),score=18.75 TRINITY_DN3482_c0_g1_i5:150-524(-)
MNGCILLYLAGFATDCSYCEGVCWPDSNMTIQERGVPPPGPAPGENLDKMEDIKPLIFHRDQLKEDGDPIQCCFYSDKQYYYTHPIITVWRENIRFQTFNTSNSSPYIRNKRQITRHNHIHMMR